jgi:hypothetical protein
MGGTAATLAACTEPPRLAPTTPMRPPAHTAATAATAVIAATRIPPPIITPDP